MAVIKTKKITITVGFEENESTLQHTVKHTIVTDKDLDDIKDAIREMDKTITGVQPLF